MTQIKQAALAYNQVAQVLQERTSSVSPMNLQELYGYCTHAKGMQQVIDAIKKYRTMGRISVLKEGRTNAYWWKTTQDVQAEPVVLEPVTPKGVVGRPKKVVDRPEITVTDKAVVIVSSKIKITIEF